MANDTKMTKSIGEHWACSELARRGWAPALTRDGISRTDILAVGTHLEHRPRIEVQVKSATQKKRPEKTSWELGKIIERLAQSEAEWFVLASIPDDPDKPLEGFVLPRDHVAAAAFISHTHWLTEPGDRPRQRTAHLDRARVMAETFAGYRSRWDLMERPTTECPVLLPEHYEDLALEERVGLPDEHPWLDEWPVWGE